MKTIQYTLADGIATVTFDEPGSPVNTMCLQWQEDMETLAQQVLQDRDAIRGIVLASAKKTFFAGADLKATMRMAPEDAGAIFTGVERMKKNFRTLETLGKPVVSLLNGAALGGGWEVALVGHHRIAVDDNKIQFGLPEVTLGLLPGASGITKMTRLLGLMGPSPTWWKAGFFLRRRHSRLAWCTRSWPRARPHTPRCAAVLLTGLPPTPRRNTPGKPRATRCRADCPPRHRWRACWSWRRQ